MNDNTVSIQVFHHDDNSLHGFNLRLSDFKNWVHKEIKSNIDDFVVELYLEDNITKTFYIGVTDNYSYVSIYNGRINKFFVEKAPQVSIENFISLYLDDKEI